jgi:hypothetical protein
MFESVLNRVIKNKPTGKFPKQSFHGGCNGCRVQNKVGTLICSMCQYYDADWNKPSLNGSDRRRWWWRQKVKFWSKFTKKPTVEKGIFHGGCIGCISQEINGVERCTGCQYFNAEWNKPDLRIENE